MGAVCSSEGTIHKIELLKPSESVNLLAYQKMTCDEFIKKMRSKWTKPKILKVKQKQSLEQRKKHLSLNLEKSL